VFAPIGQSFSLRFSARTSQQVTVRPSVTIAEAEAPVLFSELENPGVTGLGQGPEPLQQTIVITPLAQWFFLAPFPG
jgi:hypothetical protein